MTGHALQEEEPGLLVEDGVWRPTRVARHVLLDVAPQHVLNVLLLEPPCNEVKLSCCKSRQRERNL